MKLKFIAGASYYDELTDTIPRKFLDGLFEDKKRRMPVSQITAIVSSNLHMSIKVQDARARIQMLFIAYRALLKRNGISWVLDTNPKRAIRHVLATTKPQSLRQRLEEDLNGGYPELRKELPAFIEHALNASDAFDKLDLGGTSER